MKRENDFLQEVKGTLHDAKDTVKNKRGKWTKNEKYQVSGECRRMNAESEHWKPHLDHAAGEYEPIPREASCLPSSESKWSKGSKDKSLLDAQPVSERAFKAVYM